jgi:ribose transport system substrate-binding protein
VDCVAIAGALAEAKAQNATTINLGATDCDIVGEEPLFTAVVPNLDGFTQEEWWRQMGALQADWVIGQTNGEANVLLLKFVDPIWGEWLAGGFVDQLATCGGCTVGATLELTNQDFAGGILISKFSTALVEAADANAVVVPIDGWFLAGLAQAIEETGRSGDLAVIGEGGAAPNFDLIREGRGQDATVAFSFGLNAYSGIDALIRILAGEPVEDAALGLQVVDAEHNMPESGEAFRYVPALDYEDHYLAIWGVE